uniref:Uncharacterized protein n=1 Tax=Brassica oleracea var. oleracea TaxID=109376 RepID=A0A0D3AUC9_BRAOL
VNHDQILRRASRGGRHNTCVPGTWNWKYLRKTTLKLQRSKMDLRSNHFQKGGNDAPLGSAPGKTDVHGLIMGSKLLEEESDQTEFICDSYAHLGIM